VLSQVDELFLEKRRKHDKEKAELIEELYKQIGQLNVEVDWVKKKLACSVREKAALVELSHPRIRGSRQAELLGLSRSSSYYTPIPKKEDVVLTRLIDEIYTEAPCYGSRKIKAALARRGYVVGLERVQALMRSMGLAAVYPKPTLSQRHPEHWVYPYLLRGVKLSVWATDITYIRLQHGWMYLVAILDWLSRYIVSWAISTTLDTHCCLDALEVALTKGTPDIFNSDQGSQFTSQAFTDLLTAPDQHGWPRSGG